VSQNINLHRSLDGSNKSSRWT